VNVVHDIEPKIAKSTNPHVDKIGHYVQLDDESRGIIIATDGRHTLVRPLGASEHIKVLNNMVLTTSRRKPPGWVDTTPEPEPEPRRADGQPDDQPDKAPRFSARQRTPTPKAKAAASARRDDSESESDDKSDRELEHRKPAAVSADRVTVSLWAGEPRGSPPRGSRAPRTRAPMYSHARRAQARRKQNC
jgi:hypothetical protein